MELKNIQDRNRTVFDTFPDKAYTGKIPSLKSRRNNLFAWIIVLIAIPALTYTVVSLNREEEVQLAQIENQLSQRAYFVNNGVKGTVMLPDSSVVCLNSGSELYLNDNFEEERIVTLSGEAYFKVKANKNNPFYVITGKDITVKVTGTEFNLSCYKEQADIKLSLVHGSVELVKGSKTIYKMNGQEEINISNGNISESSQDIEEAIAWTKGNLMFDDTPMKDVLAKMERWYGVNIIVEDIRIYNSSFTGDFSSESIDQVLELLRITSGVKYRISGNNVYLTL